MGHKWFLSALMSDAFLDVGAGTRRPELLPGAALAAGWNPQPAPVPAAETGWARGQRLQRGRAERRLVCDRPDCSRRPIEGISP
ncbi:MAG: hypothetical protein MZU95_05580 [Desulfomicrobium escambiense]|nr:hypothetical protein [Desulfomicrobium escambiense]